VTGDGGDELKPGQGQDAVSGSGRIPALDELEHTVAALVDEGHVSETQAGHLRAILPAQMEDSRYVLKHFGVHLGIGAVFAFDAIPLPLGTLGRVGWVGVAKAGELIRGNRERARVHSLRVFLVAAIPLFGYVAYLVPLRRDHRELAFVLANHTWHKHTGRSYEQFVRARSRLTARTARAMVPLPW